MRNDEQRPVRKPPNPQGPPLHQGWMYDEEQPPVSPPAGPPVNQLSNNPHVPYLESSPLLDPMQNPVSQFPVDESYYPDLTMDMGSSLGYTQGIQHHAINMPQPTQSLPRLRRQEQRFQQLREERLRRQQRRSGPDITALIRPREPSALPEHRLASLSDELAPPSAPRPGGDLVQPGEVVRSATPRASSTTIPPNTMLRPAAAAAPAQSTAEIQRVQVARASSLISSAFLLSSILGLLQTFLFTYIFGGAPSGGAYLQAYLIPNLIYTVISGGALSSAFIPVFTSYAVKENDEKTAWHIASSALNLSVACMIVLSILAAILAPVFVPLYSNPLTSDIPLTITLTRIMLIQAVVLGSGVIISSVLNAKQNFAYTALGAVLYNVGLDVGLIPGFFMTFHTSAGASPSNTAVLAATFGVVAGALLQVGVQIPGLFKAKMQYTFAFDWRHPGVHKIVHQMIPRVFNALMLSLSTFVDRGLLTLLVGVSLNAYVQAFSILILPVSLFASSVSTAAFPTLASYAAKGRLERVRTIIMETLRGILFLTIPSGVGLMILSFPIAQALLEHGNFDLTVTKLAATTLFFFAVGLPGLAAVEILTRSFYALQDSKTPVTISIAQFILKIALSLVLVNLSVFGVQWGMGMLALSTSIAGMIEAVALFILLSRRIEGFDLLALRGFFARVLLASGALALILLVVSPILDHMIDTTSMHKLFTVGIFMAIAKLFIELGFGSLAFLVVARLLKMEEMNTGIVRRVLNLLRVPWL